LFWFAVLPPMVNRQIAGHLRLAEKTVKSYVSALLHKLGVAYRTEAAVYATRRQRSDPPQGT
jgi:DNA-binding NarL/FixJ family response regulator